MNWTYLTAKRVFSFSAFILSIISSLFVNGQDATLLGNATSIDGNCYQLTTNANTQNGGVWFDDPIDLTLPFELQYTVYLGSNDGGADGIVFVMQTVGLDAVGTGGGSVGYEGISPSVGIEFDTWQNPENGDLLNDHIGILSNGSPSHNGPTALSTVVQAHPTNANIEDNQNHNVQIFWDPELTELSVYFDCELRTSATTDLINTIFGGDSLVYHGFVGSTGGANNVQSFCIYEPSEIQDYSTSICEDGYAILNVNGNPNGSYTWSPPDGLSNPNVATPNAAPEESTLYMVEYEDFCGELITANYDVNVVPLDLLITGPEAITCLENQAELVVTSNPIFNLDYEWSTPDGVMIGDYFSPMVTALTDGTYIIEVDAGIACSGTYEYTLLDDTQGYELEAEEPIPFDCYNSELTLEASSEGDDGEPTWTTDNGIILSGENTFNPTVGAGGTYTMTVFDPNSGCESEIDVFVIDNAIAPEVFAGFEDTVSCENPILQVMGATTSATNFDIQWSADTGGLLNDTDTFSPSINGPGVYTLAVTDLDNGCTGTDDLVIYLSEEGILDFSELNMPNIFTPNNDDFNEYYIPSFLDQPEFDITSVLEDFNLKVFNRWGKEVYTWNKNNSAWKGKDSNGNELNTGTYYVVFEYTFDCGERFEESKGAYVHLVR